VDEQAVPVGPQGAVGANERLRRRPLQEGASRRVHGDPEEVVLRGVADVEPQARLERDHVNEVGGAEGALLTGWRGGERLPAQLRHRMAGGDAKDGALHPPVAAGKSDTVQGGRRRPPRGAPHEGEGASGRGARSRHPEGVGPHPLERPRRGAFEERLQPAGVLPHERPVLPVVGAQQPTPPLGAGRGPRGDGESRGGGGEEGSESDSQAQRQKRREGPGPPGPAAQRPSRRRRRASRPS
jgi:hypothetical protein